MTTRLDRTAAAATAAQQKLAKLQAKQIHLAAELKRQRKLENERIKALKDAERIELGRIVQDAGLDKARLEMLLADSNLMISAETPFGAGTKPRPTT